MLTALPFELPSPGVVIFGALLALVWAYSCLSFAGHLKTKTGLRTGYTRKVFHALIFLSAVVAHAIGGLVAVCVFGMMVSVVVGFAGNILFGPIAVVGYLVGGLGDAAGEPVGTRWGRHRYLNAKVTKTFEGSIAVLSASLVALLIGVAITPGLHFDLRSAIALPVIALACTLVEAF